MRGWKLVLASALVAGCTVTRTVPDVDALVRQSGARTVLIEDTLSLWSPYEVPRTREFLEEIRTRRDEVFGLFELDAGAPLIVRLRVNPGFAVEATAESGAEGDRMRIQRVSFQPEGDVLGQATDDYVCIEVDRLAPLRLADGRSIETFLGVSSYTRTIRHELTHVAAMRLGVRRLGWLGEGLAHAVEWLPVEDGRFPLASAPVFHLAAALPHDREAFDALLRWEQAFPVTDRDRHARALATSLVVFALAREGTPNLRENVLRLAARSDAELRALHADWSTWLESLVPPDS